MQKKNMWLVTAVVIIVVIVGGYAIFHKSSKKTPSATSSSTTSSSTSQTPPAAVNNAVLVTKSSTGAGTYLADPNGNTLYTYGGDSSGVSNCTGSCVATWPVYQDKGATTGLPTNVTTIKRTDGETQYAYKGKPLYYFASDSKGQANGNGVGDFTVAKP